jgi:hypothetical protein
MVLWSQEGEKFRPTIVSDIETILDIRLHFGYIPAILLIEGAFPEGMPRVRSPRAELPTRTRAALGPRSAGKRTGLHGACLTGG